MIRVTHHGHAPDYFLFALLVILTILGLVILASASSDLGKLRFNDSYYYLKHQLLYGLSLGIVGFLVGFFVRYRHYRTIAFVLLLINLGFLILVFTQLGVSSGGANRWLALGPFTFQPAELLKLTYIMYLAAWLANSRMKRIGDFREGLVPFFIISGIVALILILQPATSVVVMLIGAGGLMYFTSGAPWKHVVGTAIAGLMVLGLLVWFTPYRRERLLTYFNPERDTHGASYQINQALIAIGSGKTWGVGYGESTSKINLLPAPLDDSIFAIAAQELGFVGSAALTMMFFLLVFRLFWLARKMRDKFGQLLLVGFALIIMFQSLVNIGAISGIIPLTGVPLPFVSYGGTALVVFLTMGGIALNVSKYT